MSQAANTEVFSAALKGRRSAQEDSVRSIWLPKERAWLLLIADGMGGYASGDVASQIAVDQFVTAFTAARATGDDLETSFSVALKSANARIADAQALPGRENMGTTLVAAHMSREGLAWISVGDSPLWLFRQGRVYRLNEDHSLRALAKQGANVSGNLLESALNGQQLELVDCEPNPAPLRAEDLVILASDGVLTLDEEAIATAVDGNKDRGPEAVTRALLKAVEQREKPNQDNCTVLVALPGVTRSARIARKISTRGVGVAAFVLGTIAVGILAYFTWFRF